MHLTGSLIVCLRDFNVFANGFLTKEKGNMMFDYWC